MNFWYTKTDPKSSFRDLSIDIKFVAIGRGHLRPPQGGGGVLSLKIRLTNRVAGFLRADGGAQILRNGDLSLKRPGTR